LASPDHGMSHAGPVSQCNGSCRGCATDSHLERAGSDAPTSTAVTAPPSPAAPTEIEPASAPPSPSTTPTPLQAKGKRLSRSTGRAKPALIPPPAFVLFTLLCLAMSLVRGSFGALVVPSQTVRQSSACSTPAEGLTSSETAPAGSAAGIACLVATAQQPRAATPPEAARSGRVPSRAPL